MLPFKAAIVFFAFLSCLIQSIRACPPADVLHPCRCEMATPDTPDFKLHCSEFETTSGLENVLHKMRDYRLVNLKIESSAMMFMPRNFLTVKGPTVIELYRTTLITLLEEEAGETLHAEESSATQFFMSENRFMREFSFHELHPFKNLEFIHFDNMNIRQPICGNYSFTHNLKQLYLINVGLHKFDDYCFSHWPKLREIYFFRNHIKTIKGNMLPPSLDYLDLSYNRITHLPDDVFAHVPNLDRLNLAGNLLTHISEEMLLPTSVSVVWMRENPVECDCRMKWLLKREPKVYLDLFENVGVQSTCEAPEELKGMPFRNLTARNFFYCT